MITSTTKQLQDRINALETEISNIAEDISYLDMLSDTDFEVEGHTELNKAYKKVAARVEQEMLADT